MRQQIHLKAPGNWINDPNGFIYYKGRYHMFYQHFPYAPRWGTMHWGHAVSEDLTSWEHVGIALFPTQKDDQNGCFSGSAVEADGKLYFYYTGVRFLDADPEDVHQDLTGKMLASQLMIPSEDGMTFHNFKDKRTVIPVIRDKKIGSEENTRDPKIWRGKDGWYIVLGSNDDEKKGKLLFFRSEDLINWEYKNEASMDREFGWMWECPDYFDVDGQGVLTLSPMGFLNDGKKEQAQSVCMTVDFDETDCKMIFSEQYQFIDYGLDLYAPQSNLDAEGRRVMFAWARMPKPVDGEWSGMFSLPRVVEVKDGHIYFRVHPNIRRKFSRKIHSPEQSGEGGYRINIDLYENERINIGGYKIWRENHKLYADRSEVYDCAEEYRIRFETPEILEGNHLEIYVDNNLIETYINNGEYVLSSVVYGLGKEISADAACVPELYTAEK